MESSALLRVLLERDAALAGTLRRFPRFFTSALTLVEVPRALGRARREGRLSAAAFARVQRRYRAFAGNCTIAEVTPPVRDRAVVEFPAEPVRSLDALHLATMVVWSEMLGPLVMASCDQRVRANASALGFAVVPQEAAGSAGGQL